MISDEHATVDYRFAGTELSSLTDRERHDLQIDLANRFSEITGLEIRLILEVRLFGNTGARRSAASFTATIVLDSGSDPLAIIAATRIARVTPLGTVQVGQIATPVGAGTVTRHSAPPTGSPTLPTYCCRDEARDGIAWTSAASCYGDVTVTMACPNAQEGVLTRRCRLIDSRSPRQWLDPVSTCENAAIAALAAENVTDTNLEAVLLNLSIATDRASILGERDVERAAAVVVAGIDLIQAGEVNLTRSMLESFVDTASDLMNTAAVTLRGAEVTNGSVSTSIPAELEDLAVEVARDLGADELVQVVRENLVMLVVKVGTDEGLILPPASVPTGVGFSSCRRENRTVSWTCEGVSTQRDVTNVAACELPPAKYILADGNATTTPVEYLVFKNDALFAAAAEQTVNSPVVMLTVPGARDGGYFTDGQVMRYSVKHSSVDGWEADNRTCRWYDEGATASASTNRASWSIVGCSVVVAESTDTATVCACAHLTSFAVLMDVGGSAGPDQATSPDATAEAHAASLTIITYVGVSVSMVCLFLTIAAYAFFSEARTFPKKVLMHLSASLIAAMGLFIVAGSAGLGGTACAATTALLHFALLSAFCWMLAQGYTLYRQFVVVFDRSDEHLMLRKFAAFAYGVPAIIAGVTAQLAENSTHSTVCWLAGDALWAFAGPVLFVIVVNLGFFGAVMRVIATSKPAAGAADGAKKIAKMAAAKRNFKATGSFFSLMGVTWVFGLLSLANIDSLVYQYLFSILNAFTGLWIFLFHCYIDPSLRASVGLYFHRRFRWAKNSRRGGAVMRRSARTSSTNASKVPSSSRQSASEQVGDGAVSWRDQVKLDAQKRGSDASATSSSSTDRAGRTKAVSWREEVRRNAQRAELQWVGEEAAPTQPPRRSDESVGFEVHPAAPEEHGVTPVPSPAALEGAVLWSVDSELEEIGRQVAANEEALVSSTTTVVTVDVCTDDVGDAGRAQTGPKDLFMCTPL